MKYNKTLIIAEVGVNHNGRIIEAFKLIKKAKEIGADIVKFQTFTAENTVVKTLKKGKYKKLDRKNGESQFSMLKKLELSYK